VIDLQPLADAARRFADMVPNRDRTITFYDLETTGFEGARDHLLEVGAAALHVDDTLNVWSQLFKPPVPITREITELTGISDADVADAATWNLSTATQLRDALADSDLGGYNIKGFDNRFLVAACARVGVDLDLTRARIVDGYVLWGKVERRDLASYVSRFAGRDHAGAHRAAADVVGTLDGLCGFLATFRDAPRTVQGIHDVSFPIDKNWIDAEGKFAWDANGNAVVNFGSKKGTPLALVDPGFFKWVIRSEFTPEQKTIAQNAIHGRLPVRTR